ncbi:MULTISPECIES: hypothetical protein [unclassified Nostoc]|uniref:hypothetical protein n=1 Tax=unclassified Nostoc TaxID=2593658 RepID=UPI001DE97276|nr:hypothetical protein [Nostoc sp. JL23]MBN3880612.1 hypothetical protein [Nostoc sp. JL23]
MPNEAANQEQNFLIDLLRATYQNQEVYLILQHNLSKLNNDLALMLRKFNIFIFNLIIAVIDWIRTPKSLL